jgi:hypothetical protein
MFEHQLPEYIPQTVGIGEKYKVAIQARPIQFTPLFEKERVGLDQYAEKADRWFLATLIALYGRENFMRGNLDAGRLNRLFGREIVPADPVTFNATSSESELCIEFGSAFAYLSSMQ